MGSNVFNHKNNNLNKSHGYLELAAPPVWYDHWGWFDYFHSTKLVT
jgi:hypothetical protein